MRAARPQNLGLSNLKLRSRTPGRRLWKWKIRAFPLTPINVIGTNSRNCNEIQSTTFFTCVPPDPNQCHRNELTDLLKYWGLSGAKACTSCRSRRELSNEYLLAKIGVDTAENEPCKDLQASSALWNREIFAILTLIGVWGMKIIMKVHQKMGRVSRPVFYIKWHWMGSGGKHIRKHIQVRSVVTLNGVWGQAHPKTYTSAERSETLMSDFARCNLFHFHTFIFSTWFSIFPAKINFRR